LSLLACSTPISRTEHPAMIEDLRSELDAHRDRLVELRRFL
jgi:hypothetical protein